MARRDTLCRQSGHLVMGVAMENPPPFHTHGRLAWIIANGPREAARSGGLLQRVVTGGARPETVENTPGCAAPGATKRTITRRARR